MSGATKIEWAERVWNPIIGCNHVHAGCDHCYAARMATRLAGNPKTPQYHGLANGGRWTGEVFLVEDELNKPLHWRNPSRIFLLSMGDLFHDKVCDVWRDNVFSVVLACLAICKGHEFILLTKRPENARRYFASRSPVEHLITWSKLGRTIVELDGGDTTLEEWCSGFCSAHWRDDWTAVESVRLTAPWKVPENLFPLPNLTLGVSVCDQSTADAMIPILLQIPAARRIVSIEPMLGPVDLFHLSLGYGVFEPVSGKSRVGSFHFVLNGLRGAPRSGIPALNGVIVGSETGPGARPMDLAWARAIRDQCQQAGVAFFFKKDSEGRQTLDGHEHHEWPEVKR